MQKKNTMISTYTFVPLLKIVLKNCDLKGEFRAYHLKFYCNIIVCIPNILYKIEYIHHDAS